MHDWSGAVDHRIYRIRVNGSVDQRLAQRLGMEVDDLSGQEAILFGPVLDQASLIGLINTLYDYGYSLLSVESQTD